MPTKHPTRSAVAVRSLARLLLAGASLAAVARLSAQTTPTADANPGEETVELPVFTVSTTQDKGYRAGNSVSATRIDTPIKDLPFTVSAFTDQFIEDIGARELTDIIAFAPGVTSGAKEFTQGNTRFSIRGFDGAVPPQRNGFVGNLYVDAANISRVEVVKGPSSLLYGQITPGGTVNYITKRPTPKRFVKVEQQAGSYSFYRTELDVNQPLIPGGVLFRVVGAYENGLEYFNGQSSRSSLIAPSLTLNFNDKMSLTVDYEWARRMEAPLVGMQPNTQIAGLNGAPSAANYPNLAARSRQQALSDVGNLNLGFLDAPPLSRRFNYVNLGDNRESNFETFNAEYNVKFGPMWSARANYNWNKFRITNKLTGLAEFAVTPTAAYRSTTLSLFDYLREYQANPAGVLADPTKTATATLTRRKRLQLTQSETNAYQAELAGNLEFGSVKVKPLFGAFLLGTDGEGFTRTGTGTDFFTPWNYFDQNTWDRTGDYDPALLPIDNGYNRNDSTDTAFYGLVTASFLDDRLIAVGGARYNKTETDTYNYNLANRPLNSTYEATKTTPQYGLGYKITKDILVYASYSESFLVEARTLNRPNPAYNGNIPYDPITNPTSITTAAVPTTGIGYEVGLKTDLFDGRVSSTLAFFNLERENRVLTVRQGIDILNANGTPGTPRQETFSSQSTVDQSEGFELEVTYSPLDNLQIYATVAAMEIKTTEFTPPPARTSTDPLVSGDYNAYLAGYNEAISLIKGAVPEGSAEKLASLWARYSFNDGALDGLWIGGGAVYTGEKAQRTANPTLFFEDYTIFDAAIGYDFKVQSVPLTATLNWKNITNEEYYPANQARGLPERFIFSLSARF